MVAMTRNMGASAGSSKNGVAPMWLPAAPCGRDLVVELSRSLLTAAQAGSPSGPIWMIAMVPGRKTPEPPDEQPPVPQLTRVRMSALGAARCPNLAGREGVIVGAGRYRSTVRVMFDGFKWPTSLHSTYIEAVVEEGPSTHVQARR